MLKRVVIDPGHSGKDSGAVGATGTLEKTINLLVAHMVADYLRPFIDVRLTREDDTFVSLQKRAEMANVLRAEAFLSIHCNSANNRAAKGIEIWTTKGQTTGDILADCVFHELKSKLPTFRYRTDYSDGDADKESNFAVLRLTRMPACLVELGFISNPAEEAILKTTSYQRKAAVAIGDGIAAFLGVHLLPQSTFASKTYSASAQK